MPPDGPAAPTPDAPGSRAVAVRMALLSAGTLLSRALGMVRETLIAATFTVVETDAFFIAWRIPNALRALLAEGALSAAFVPVFSATLVHGREAFSGAAPDNAARAARDLSPEARDALARSHHEALREVVARVRAASLAVLIPLSVLGVLFARPALRLLAGDFGGDTARFELSAHLLRQLFPYIFFMGSAAVGVGVLQSLGRYTALAFAPALLNVAFLVAPFAFVPLAVRWGLPAVDGLAWGALLGGALQLVALVPSLRRLGMLPRPVLDLQHPAVRRVGTLLAPQLLGLAIYQIDVVLSNRFLASLPAGATSWFSYAQRLADIPQGLFILAIASSYLPELSRSMAAGDRDAAAGMLSRMVRLAVFVAVPVAAILGCYAEAIVPLVYGYGRFQALGPQAVLEVAASLRWQAANVALLALVRQLTAVFSAAQDPKTPVLVSGIDLLVYVALALALRGPLGHVGVAAALVGSTAVQLVLLAARAPRHLTLPWAEVLPSLARVVLAAAVTGAAARALVTVIPWQTPGLVARAMCVAGGAGLITVYVLAAWLLRISEVRLLVDKVRRRLRRRPSTV